MGNDDEYGVTNGVNYGAGTTTVMGQNVEYTDLPPAELRHFDGIVRELGKSCKARAASN